MSALLMFSLFSELPVHQIQPETLKGLTDIFLGDHDLN